MFIQQLVIYLLNENEIEMMFNVNLIQCETNLQKQKNTPMLFQTLIIMTLLFGTF